MRSVRFRVFAAALGGGLLLLLVARFDYVASFRGQELRAGFTLLWDPSAWWSYLRSPMGLGLHLASAAAFSLAFAAMAWRRGDRNERTPVQGRASERRLRHGRSPGPP